MAQDFSNVKIEFNQEKWAADMAALKSYFDSWAEVVRTSLIFAGLTRDIRRMEAKLVHTQYRQKRGKRW